VFRPCARCGTCPRWRPPHGLGARASALATVAGVGELVVRLDADLHPRLSRLVGELRQHFADGLDTALQVELGWIARGEVPNDWDAQHAASSIHSRAFVQRLFPHARVGGGHRTEVASTATGSFIDRKSARSRFWFARMDSSVMTSPSSSRKSTPAYPYAAAFRAVNSRIHSATRVLQRESSFC